MKTKAAIFLSIVLFLFAWAPWMSRDAVYAIVTDKHRVIGVEEGGAGCDYQVMWAPFGRWAASCEEGHYVLFIGVLLF